MLGGVATICGLCSYKWIVSPAVARSYRCPQCQGNWGASVANNACTCCHSYGEHHYKSVLPASRAAFGIKASDAHLLPEILATVATIPDDIGRCDICACECFHLAGRRETL